MKNNKVFKGFASSVLAFAILAMPFSAFAQTRIATPKNKYKVEDDVKLGREAAQQAEQQLPILRDNTATDYVERVGQRLADAIPSEYQHSEFRYSFKIVNANDINAFALPGGPMYVNRGMIQAAKTEGEMAGVMAHELSHVALRHGTAQQTKLSSPKNQILGIGAILGGAIVGGETGAAIGQTIVAAAFTRYSREYETQADVLGAQIMARAGYDPRDLANMFKTIESQGGSGTPEFLSDHPAPARRYERINQEAALLRVTNPIRDNGEFARIKSRLAGMPRAQSSAEIERNGQRNPNGTGTGSGNGNGGTYSRSVPAPSTRYQNYNGNSISVSIPDNWESNGSGDSAQFAPQGGYGSEGITHGALIGVSSVQNRNSTLRTGSDEYLQSILQAEGNNYLRQQRGFSRYTIDGREALTATLSGRSPITGSTEIVTIYTTQLNSGDIFYVATVAPQNEASSYNRAFSSMIRSLRINDR